MQTFDESLITFLVNGREIALDELKADKQYSEWKDKHKELHSRLESLLTPDVLAVLEECNETTAAITSKEYNTILLRGLTLLPDIRRRFETSEPDYKALVAKFLNQQT